MMLATQLIEMCSKIFSCTISKLKIVFLVTSSVAIIKVDMGNDQKLLACTSSMVVHWAIGGPSQAGWSTLSLYIWSIIA
jgi:hypothetical protein